MSLQTAVISGASGLIGRRIAERLLAQGGWRVIGLSRHARSIEGMESIAVDLSDAVDCELRLAKLCDVTHIFNAARYDHPEGTPESVEVNAAMLRNLVLTLEPRGQLQHVHALQGSKYYGHQLGPVPVPLREESPRAKNLNYYFEQEDFLREQSRGKAWSYSTSRPHCFCDPAVDQPRSIGLVIAAYAAIQRELGEPLDFPGTAAGFNVHTQFTDLHLLARAIVWMTEEPRCANQAFNVVNGDAPRWPDLWRELAAWFGMKVGVPRAIKLTDYMADKRPVWERIIAKHHLQKTDLQTLALWAYGDYQLSPEWDVTSSMDKARALGFNDSVDSHAMLIRQFENYRAAKIIPDY